MDISKYKEVIQRISFLKNYSSLLVPAVLALVAVLIFIPTRLMSSKLKDLMAAKSIMLGNRIQYLNDTPVSFNQQQEEQRYQLAFERDANSVALLGKRSTQRELLSYKIFPEPKDTSVLIFEEFGQRFRIALEELISSLNAVDCPMEAELARSLQSSSASGWGGGSSYWRSSEADATIRDVICRAKAESGYVYANPTDLSGYEYWGGYKYAGMDEAVKDCWYYQLAYWIIEDIVATIDALNSGSDSVFTSPVKRLLRVSFAIGGGGSWGYDGRLAGDKPSYVFSSDQGQDPTGQTLTISCTARVSDDDIDVVHFNVGVVVSTKAILPFMRELCSAKQHKFKGWKSEDTLPQPFEHNQITILETNIWPVSQGDEIRSLYRYGEDAVVELDLICEYIFNKEGYDEIKPESVKGPPIGLGGGLF